MKGFWMTFADGTHGYCEGSNEFDAKQIAEKLTGKTVAGGKYKDIAATPLPYPAKPIIWQLDHPVNGKTPDFCYTPDQCAGKGSCPHQRACTE